MEATVERKRSMGLAIGSLWLIAVGGSFASFALLATATTGSRVAFGLLVVVALALIAVGVRMVRLASALPRSTAPPSSQDRLLASRFAVIVLIEILAFATLNPLMASRGHFEALVAINLEIVGLHFLPLAMLFQVPRYYVMGALFCLIPAACLLWMPSDQHVGAALGWYTVPALGCGVVAVVTGAAGLLETRRSLASINQAVI